MKKKKIKKLMRKFLKDYDWRAVWDTNKCGLNRSELMAINSLFKKIIRTL